MVLCMVSRVHLHLFLLTANEFVLILNIQVRNHQYICRQLPATPNEQQVDGKLSYMETRPMTVKSCCSS
jgi:hypothetical protein